MTIAHRLITIATIESCWEFTTVAQYCRVCRPGIRTQFAILVSVNVGWCTQKRKRKTLLRCRSLRPSLVVVNTVVVVVNTIVGERKSKTLLRHRSLDASLNGHRPRKLKTLLRHRSLSTSLGGQTAFSCGSGLMGARLTALVLTWLGSRGRPADRSRAICYHKRTDRCLRRCRRSSFCRAPSSLSLLLCWFFDFRRG